MQQKYLKINQRSCVRRYGTNTQARAAVQNSSTVKSHAMNNKVVRFGFKSLSFIRKISVTSSRNAKHSCKLLVIGGGTGGCSMAAKFCRRLGPKKVIILEPTSTHYYQALFTLVGGGAKSLSQTGRPMSAVLPSDAVWLKDSASAIQPDTNTVVTGKGDEIQYEYLIVSAGIDNHFEKIPGLKEALDDPKSGVSTIYSADYVTKTWSDLQNFSGGDAIFTYPDTWIKCPGAPQKIVYLTDSYLTKKNIRSKANITYTTALPVIFGVKKYADALMKVVERKKIDVKFHTVLKAVHHQKKEAVFKKEDGSETTLPYNLLHVGPPMIAPAFLQHGKVADDHGFLDVDKYTLQHKRYKNIYGIGDCTNTPNSKTAAAIAKQCYVVEHNLLRTMKEEDPKMKYDGYGGCPLVTSYHTCIMAEFIYDGVVHETFPFDQSKERILMYFLKSEVFPFMYWNFMLKGRYHGPGLVRKIINPFAK